MQLCTTSFQHKLTRCFFFLLNREVLKCKNPTFLGGRAKAKNSAVSKGLHFCIVHSRDLYHRSKKGWNHTGSVTQKALLQCTRLWSRIVIENCFWYFNSWTSKKSWREIGKGKLQTFSRKNWWSIHETGTCRTRRIMSFNFSLCNRKIQNETVFEATQVSLRLDSLNTKRLHCGSWAQVQKPQRRSSCEYFRSFRSKADLCSGLFDKAKSNYYNIFW